MKRMLITALLLGLLSLGALAAPKKGTWTGVVSDTKCGAAMHDAGCVKKCVEAGQKLAFVNDADKSVLEVANPEALKGHEGHHVKVKGTVDGNVLTVSSVSMLKDQGMKQDSSMQHDHMGGEKWLFPMTPCSQKGMMLSRLGSFAPGDMPDFDTSLGMAIAAPVADHLGIQVWWWLGGIACLLMGAAGFLIPAVMRIED